jgi:4-oxalocrotonate tautomerase
MPFLNVLISATDTTFADIQCVTSALASATKDILGQDPGVTSIAVQTVPPSQWTIAGHTLQAQAKRAYWVDIKITAATNTKSELARYVSAVHTALRTELGAVHEESYVLVHEVHASAYGYGGKTQEHRYVVADLAAPQA